MGDHHKPDRKKAQTDTNLLQTRKSQLENQELQGQAEGMRHSDTDASREDLHRYSRAFSVAAYSIFTNKKPLRESLEMRHPARSIGLPRLPTSRST